MAKARRMKKKEVPKKIKNLRILFILVVIVFLVLFCLIKTNKIAFLSEIFDNLKFGDVETISTKLADEDLTNNSTSEESSDKVNNKSSDELNDKISAKSSDKLTALSNESKVTNSDKLKSDGITITNSSNDSCMISTTIHNISSKKIKNIKLTLYLYNSNGAEISTFEFSVDSILPSGKSSLFTISQSDLSDAHYYNLTFDK